MKFKQIALLVAFCTAIASLTTIMIPVLSLIMGITGLTFSVLAWGSKPKGMLWAAFGMSILGLIQVLIYSLVS